MLKVEYEGSKSSAIVCGVACGIIIARIFGLVGLLIENLILIPSLIYMLIHKPPPRINVKWKRND